MESFGLYEDLSLFSGDLLVGVTPLASELPIPGQDGCFQEPEMFPAQVDLFADEPLKPSKPDPPVDDDWMEKKLDLINLLSSPNVHITLQETDLGATSLTPTSPIKTELMTPEPIAPPQIIEVSFPEDTQSENVAIESLLENVSEYLSSDIGIAIPSATHHGDSSANISFGDLGVDAFGTADGLASLLSDHEMKALNDPILSPVSPQDVESILSGPSSPCSSTASINDGVVPQMKTIDSDALFFSNNTANIITDDEPCFMQEPSIPMQSPIGESYHRSALSPPPSGPMRPVRVSRAKKYSPYKDFEDTDEDDSYSGSSSKKGSKSNAATPRSVYSPDRKERKKKQNKDAALRYRQKKKQEQNTVFEECDELEKKNEDLKDKVDGMTREIQYLKDLLLEVYKAKGIQPVKGLLVK